MEDWHALAKVIRGKTNLKEYILVALCRREFVPNVTNCLLDDNLADGKWEMEKLRAPTLITPAMFKCFEGDVRSKDILTIVKNHEALLKID